MYLKLGLGEWISFPYELYALANEKWNLHSKKFVYLKLGFGQKIGFRKNLLYLHQIHAEIRGRAVNCHFFSAEAKNLNFWKISAWIVRGEGTGDARAHASHARVASHASHATRRTRRAARVQAIKNRTITTKGGEEKKSIHATRRTAQPRAGRQKIASAKGNIL